MSNPVSTADPVRAALARCRPHFIAAAAFSAGSNILYLTPSLFMMQVYDRVVPTGGLTTLVALSLVALFGLATLSVLEWLRSRLLVRASAKLEAELAGPTLRIAMAQPGLTRPERAEAMRDFDTLRQGLGGAGMIAALDAPWTPIYIVVAYLLHPALGVLAFLSAVLLLLLAWSNERATAGPIRLANEAATAAYARQIHSSAHAAEVRALGMVTALSRLQLDERSGANRLQAQASFAGGTHGSLIKFFRLVLQSAALGLGAVLVIDGALSAGAMFAASLLVARALAPIEQIVAAWKPILQSRNAYVRLSHLFVHRPETPQTRLLDPTGAVQVERLTVMTPASDRVALADVSFSIAAGEVVGLVGLSGAGKSSLLRAIAGASPAARGHIRFDAASMADWDTERLARHIGYLPQSFILFPGSVKDNISRFRAWLGEDPAAVDAATIAAAQAIGAHEMILRLPQGYDTPIGTGGIGLSAGQTQRIAIARALFGSPRLLVLDEPTAHLDAGAQHAFMRTLSRLRGDKVTVLFATHSNDILASADKVLVLKEGRVDRFGPIKAAAREAALQPVSHSPRK